MLDVTLSCNDCNQPFVLTVREQEYFASRNIINPPIRCYECRKTKQARRAVEASQTQWLTCQDCSIQFQFTYGEQEYYASRKLSNPTRCKACRERNKTQTKSNPVNNTGQPRQMYSVICATCGIQTQVPFLPKPGRPVYCRSCYQVQRTS